MKISAQTSIPSLNPSKPDRLLVKVLHIYVSAAHTYFGHHNREPGADPMVEVDSVECVAGKGLKGDRFFGHKEDYKGQVTFFSQAVFVEMCERFEERGKAPSAFRRNVIVEGVDLNALIGTEFELQGIRFLGTEECSPCYWMNRAFAEGAHDALKGNGGLRAKILSNGVLCREA